MPRPYGSMVDGPGVFMAVPSRDSPPRAGGEPPVNAVFERDFVAFSTSARFLWLRFAFAAAMGVMLLARVLPAYASADFGNVGSAVFNSAVVVGLLLMLVTVPGSFATVLVHARAGSTLPVLLTTPLSPLSIAAGAFFARAALVLV